MLDPVQDLGKLAGPLLIFGGPYSNLAATQAIKTLAEAEGLGPEQIICSGDLVAYCAEPRQTLALIRDWGIPVVMGNCEEALAEDAGDCGCGFETGSTCAGLSVDWYDYARRQIGADNRAWMAALPRAIRFDLAGRSCLVVHGGVSQINRFIFASSDIEEKDRQLSEAAVDVAIGGHCGLPFGQRLAHGVWLNAGVIGMPANDGTADGWCLLLDVEGDAVRARWLRLTYDAAASRRAMDAIGLSPAYAKALISGIWPSRDILPKAEQSEQGRPLSILDLRF